MSESILRTAVTAGILAGGEGRRFGGADKGWLTLHGEPLIARLVAALAPQADELLISANRNLHRYARFGVPVLPDRLGAGPLAGVATLLAAARHPWLLCVPVDGVRLPRDWAARCVAAAQDSGADIVALHDGARAHPTFALVATHLAGDAQQALGRGEFALQAWFARHRLHWLTAPAPVNCNTPADLAALEGAA